MLKALRAKKKYHKKVVEDIELCSISLSHVSQSHADVMLCETSFLNRIGVDNEIWA